MFSGRFFDAEEALALGLIDEMVAPDDVYDAAAAWARRAGVDAVFELPRAERLAAEQRRYVEVFSAGQGGDAGADPHGG